jgi:hypothetical protein
MNEQRAIQIISSLYEMPVPREHKCRTLFNLASRVTSGCIVELGTFHGNGALALCLGALAGERGIRVITVDDYSEKQGWFGERYGPGDRRICIDNLSLVGALQDAHHHGGVVMIDADVLSFAAAWYSSILYFPIGLLFWDLGARERLASDLDAWIPHVTPGGTIAVHDTSNAVLGATQAMDALGFEYSIHPGGVWVAEVPE